MIIFFIVLIVISFSSLILLSYSIKVVCISGDSAGGGTFSTTSIVSISMVEEAAPISLNLRAEERYARFEGADSLIIGFNGRVEATAHFGPMLGEIAESFIEIMA